MFVNGEAFNCDYSMSLYDLLTYLDFDVNRVVVEYNQKIISSYDLSEIVLTNHDKLEIITIVGGG